MPGEDRHRKIGRQVVIQDRLAMDLTSLANERTLLMYVRTALGFLAAGVALIHFFENPWMVVVGWALIPLGFACAIFGVARYNHVRNVLRHQWHLRSMEDDEIGGDE